MSDVLVVYATVEGHSRKIAGYICDHVVRLCRGARIVDAAGLPADLRIQSYAAVIVVAPVHMGRHHPAALKFVGEYADYLQRHPAALVSVSLHAADLVPGDLDEARAYADEFAAETGWMPEAVHYAGGALKFAKFDFFKRWMLRRIAADRGIKPHADEDMEFTDWRALEMFVDSFLREHAPLSA